MMIYIKPRLKYINELINHNKQDDYNDTSFVLYKSDVWFFTEKQFKKIKLELTKVFNNKIDLSYTSNIHDLIDALIEFPLILCGYIRNNEVIIQSSDFSHSFNSSDVKKLYNIVKLPIYVINHDGDEKQLLDISKTYDKDTIYYHGTCLKFLPDILKYGIKPKDFANYDVNHTDKIFFTTDLNKANFHGLTTSINNKSFPIIVAFKVPDSDKLIPDYDLAITVYGKEHDIIKKHEYDKFDLAKDYGNEPNLKYDRNITNKIGVFGYLGRIPTSFIVDIFIDLVEYSENMGYFHPEFGEFPSAPVFYSIDFSSPHDWSEISPKDVLQRVESIEDEYSGEFDGDDELDVDLEDA